MAFSFVVFACRSWRRRVQENDGLERQNGTFSLWHALRATVECQQKRLGSSSFSSFRSMIINGYSYILDSYILEIFKRNVSAKNSFFIDDMEYMNTKNATI